jgi:hypothetical protein
MYMVVEIGQTASLRDQVQTDLPAAGLKPRGLSATYPN